MSHGIKLQRVGQILVVIVVLGVVLAIVNRPDSDTVKAKAAADNATSSVGSSPSARSTPTPTTTVAANDPYAAITQRANRIVEAYYLLKPDDTEATRRARITAVVSASVMSTPDFSVGSISCQDQARLKHHLTEKAVLQPSSVQPIGDGVTYVMNVPGTVVQYATDGSAFAGSATCPAAWPFTATFQWRKNGNSWQLVNFGNPVEQP